MPDRRIFLLTAPLLLVGCEFEGDWNSERHKEDFHMSYPLKAGQRVSLEGFNGSVEVMGWEKDEVDISGVKYASSKEMLDRLKVDVSASADAVRIRVVRPEERNWRGGMGVKFVVRVPKKTELERIESTNGSLRVEDVEGAARLKSTNGAIRALRVVGKLDATSTNGGIELSGTVGDAVLHTTNGSIRADEVRGGLDAGTTNGGIRVRVADADGKTVRARTTNGSVTVQMPAGVKAEFRASTSNASITSDFEVTGTKEKRHWEGTINGGGALIDLSTSNGAIRLERM